MQKFIFFELPPNSVQFCSYLTWIIFICIGTKWEGQTVNIQQLKNKDHPTAGWLPVHRDQLRAQRSVASMGKHLPLMQFAAILTIDSKRPHCWCHLPNKVENIDCMLDISHTEQWVGMPQIIPFPVGSQSPYRPVNWFLGLTRVHIPNRTLISVAIFVGLTVVTNTHTCLLYTSPSPRD